MRCSRLGAVLLAILAGTASGSAAEPGPPREIIHAPKPSPRTGLLDPPAMSLRHPLDHLKTEPQGEFGMMNDE